MITEDDIDNDMIEFVRATNPKPLGPVQPPRVYVYSSQIVSPTTAYKHEEEKKKIPYDPSTTPAIVRPATTYNLRHISYGFYIYQNTVHIQIHMGLSTYDIVHSDEVEIPVIYNHWIITRVGSGTIVDSPSQLIAFNAASWTPPDFPDESSVIVDAFSPGYGPQVGDLVDFKITYKIRHVQSQTYAEHIILTGSHWLSQPNPAEAPSEFSAPLA